MIVVISGPGGTGKGTLVSRLVARDPRLWLSRSWTTRPRRPAEDPEAYTFVDAEAFARAVAEGRFLEWAEFVGHCYGTPWPDPPPGRDVLLEIELQGAQQVLARYPDAVLVLLVPPSAEVQAERLRHRGDAEEEVQRRLAKGREEERLGRTLTANVVVNDDLQKALVEVAGILDAHRRGAPPTSGTGPSEGA